MTGILVMLGKKQRIHAAKETFPGAFNHA